MEPDAPLPVREAAGDAIGAGLLAAALSAVALMWRGRTDAGSAAAPLNAVSHWIWPRAALRRNDVSLKHTVTGTLTHAGASVFWAALYALLRHGRRQPTAVNAVTDAAATAAVAAVVDFKVVPERLTPGFEKRLNRGSLVLVYAGFAAGLALAGIRSLNR